MLKNYKYFLLERNLIPRIKKFCNVPQIYNWANKIDSNQALWLSNIIVNQIKKVNDNKYLDESKIKNREQKLKEFLKNGESSDKLFDKIMAKSIKVLQTIYKEDINKVLDYVNSPIHENKPNINKLSLEEAKKISLKWHKEIEQYTGTPIENEEGEVLMEFDDGYYWIDLQTSSCSDEAKSMGHCGNVNASTTLISLRDNKKRPHVTIGYEEDDNKFTQIKGKNNTKPIEKYHPYIVDLIIDLNVEEFKSEHDRDSDFVPDDLSEELYKKLEDGNPTYIENSKPMDIEDLRDLYRDMLWNNDSDFDESIYPHQFWYHVDEDEFFDDFISNEATEREFKGQFNEEELIDWIREKIDEKELKEYLVKKIKDWYEDENEQNEKLEKIEEEPYDFIDEEELFEQSDIEDIIIDLSDPYDFKYEYYDDEYKDRDPAEVYRQFYGDPYGELRMKHLGMFMPYFDKGKYIDRMVDDADEDFLRGFE